MIGAREMRRQEADEHGRNFVGTSDCSEYPKRSRGGKLLYQLSEAKNGLSGEIWRSYQKT